MRNEINEIFNITSPNCRMITIFNLKSRSLMLNVKSAKIQRKLFKGFDSHSLEQYFMF